MNCEGKHDFNEWKREKREEKNEERNEWFVSFVHFILASIPFHWNEVNKERTKPVIHLSFIVFFLLFSLLFTLFPSFFSLFFYNEWKEAWKERKRKEKGGKRRK